MSRYKVRPGRSRTRFVALAVAGLALASGLAGCGPPADGYEIKVGLVHPASHSYYQAFTRFKDEVEQRSEGRVRVKIFHSGQLGGEREMQEMVTLGTLEMALSGILVIYDPLFAVFELPYLYDDRDHVKRVMASGLIQRTGEPLRQHNLRVVGMYENGFRNITNSTRAIRTPRDVGGLKIRVPENPAQLETFGLLGSVVTPMSISELYSALQQNVVDGQENPLQNIMSGKYFEVQRHLSMTGHIYNLAYVIVNDRFWSGLPEELQGIVQEALDASSAYQLELAARLDIELLDTLKARGMQVTHPDRDAFREATLPVYDRFYTRFGGRARGIVEEIHSLRAAPAPSATDSDRP
jgi:tripartite ATP-independent transporter DctP family solute receptor